MAGRLAELLGVDLRTVPLSPELETRVVELLLANPSGGAPLAYVNFGVLDPADLAAFIDDVLRAAGPDDPELHRICRLLAARAYLAWKLGPLVSWHRTQRPGRPS